MRRSILILLILISFLITTDIASARDGRHYYHGPSYRSGFYISPPVIRIAPPVHYRPYYPSYRIYPPADYYEYGYKVWVPGYWEERWMPYGWERVWVPGYWRYEY
jgi:hypothetical protein